ncbi:phosphotransferase [Bacillus sp. 165]|uniref:phosphotransferase enzyme family protein n=1 Tax=Bacillus sp. 165 TaxID=1529117 RepID=UPI001ADAF956|nr:phosphotransferase [Bacillus sp. 165]
MYFTKNAAFLEQLTVEKLQHYVDEFHVDAKVEEYTISAEGQENITLFLHENGRAQFVFKIYSMPEGHFKASDIESIMIREGAFCEYLRQRGVPIPTSYQTKKDQCYIKEQWQGYLLFFTLSEFIPGRIEVYSPAYIREAGRLQAYMHEVSEGFPIDQFYQENEYSMLAYRMKQAASIETALFPHELYNEMMELYNEIQPVLFEFYQTQKKIMIHCDIKHDNILMNKTKIRALLDFGDSRYSTVHEDVGASLFYLCEYMSERKREFTMLIPLYLQVYSRARNWNLSSEDKRMILYYAMERFLILNLYYLTLEQHDDEELRFQEKIARRQWNVVKKLRILQKTI